jgi:hypothetical protein
LALTPTPGSVVAVVDVVVDTEVLVAELLELDDAHHTPPSSLR